MSDQDSKTEQPTEKRLREAREKGQIARAPEFQAIAALVGALSVMIFAGKHIAGRVAEISIGMFGHLHEFNVSAERIGDWTKLGVVGVIGLSMPVLGGAALAGLLAGGLQSKFELSPKALDLQWSRLDPTQGWKRIASKDGAMRLLVDSLKLGIVGSLLYSSVQKIVSDPVFHSEVAPHRLGEFIYDTTLTLLLRFSLALGGIAALNYFHQRMKLTKDLMMTREEVKEEFKSSEGDPTMRAMRKQLARRILQKQMLSAIPQADVVITNPTHFAVVLKYERGVDQAPVVLAKGENAFAQRIKAIARNHGVPMVENKPVARMLFKFGRVGQAIPIQLYQAVAEILGFVYRTHRYYFHELKQRRLAA